MGLPVGEVQSAAISLLRADTTLRGLLIGSVTPTWSVYDADGVPTLKAFPYVVLNIVTGKLGTLLVFGTDAVDVYLQVSTFDQNFGYKRSRGIAKQVHADLEWLPLTLAGGFTNVYLAVDNYNEIMEKDGLTSHIAQRFKLMVSG
jgi:hypothetical protein